MPAEDDPIDVICRKHAILMQAEQTTVPANLRQKIVTAASSLQEHDKTAANFVKRYKSRWGYTLFGRCLGADTPETRAAHKTKFGWMRYPQAAQVTEDSRLLYLVIKMLKNQPPTNHLSSPSKITASIKGQYKRIVDRRKEEGQLQGYSNTKGKASPDSALKRANASSSNSTNIPTTTHQIDLRCSTRTFITLLVKGVSPTPLPDVYLQKIAPVGRGDTDRWSELRDLKGFDSDADLATFLLDKGRSPYGKLFGILKSFIRIPETKPLI
ncbi:uncharacterized protein LOC117805462 [Scomber scombrus]|uniref:Uncharacterized protein LOC117805462 n=1 Tax=Scomber scombrus TaxID=13677 RepID=A0AAV1PGQ3_SCOSC